MANDSSSSTKNGVASAVPVYTDGACSGNPGPGGWAWAVPDGPSNSGSEPDTTNQRMELRAVLEAVTTLDGPVAVFSDSTYVVNCFNDRWYEGWLARNWRNSQKKPVANRDLWEPLVQIFQDRQDELSFTWVKGHSGDPMNDLVDQMAVEARDSVTAAPESDGDDCPVAPWPADRAMVVGGTGKPTRKHLVNLDRAMDGLDPGRDIVVSGLRRGSELSGAEMAVDHRVPLAVVLPFADPARGWSAADRRRFNRCVEAAEWVVELDGRADKPGTAVRKRDRWLARSAVGYLVVGDTALAERLDESGLSVIEVDDSDLDAD